jgi:hypothetical protein
MLDEHRITQMSVNAIQYLCDLERSLTFIVCNARDDPPPLIGSLPLAQNNRRVFRLDERVGKKLTATEFRPPGDFAESSRDVLQ